MKKPSKIEVVTAKKAFLLPSAFRAITLFGVVYCQKESDIKLINQTDEIDSILKSHETIHVRQAESKRNSWLLFYLAYIWQWICNLPIIFTGFYMPYKFIEFELEAFSNEADYSYCTNGPVYQWKYFKKLTLKDKRNFSKQYKKSHMLFRNFINEIIIPYINEKG